MKTSSTARLESARRNLKNLLQAASGVTEQQLASSIDVSESVVQRLKSVHAENFACLLAELDLKIVKSSLQCYPPEYVESLKYLAGYAVLPNTPTPVLAWE